MRWLAIVTLGITLSACGYSGDTASDPTGTAPPLSDPTDPQAPSPSPPTPSDPQQAITCDDPARSGIEKTIRDQQVAFAEADYAGARSFATRGFQSTVSVQQFQEIIEAQYSALLGNPVLEFLDCQRIDDLAQILVRVENAMDLRYRMIRQSDGWRIDGASLAESAREIAA